MEQDVMARYGDIIDLPRPVSERHARMSMGDRAAQFSPFAALTGYDAAVEETARLTQDRIELDESRKAELDRRLRQLRECPGMTACVTYFVPDDRKPGGAYVTVTGQFRRLDHGMLILEDGARIRIEEIFDLVLPEQPEMQ